MARVIFSILFSVLSLCISVIPAEAGIHDDDPEEYFNQGRTYLVQGNEVKASEAFDKAVSIDKSYSAKVLDEYYSAGLILIKEPKKSNIGIHYLNKYLAGNPDKGKDIAPILYDEGRQMVAMNKYMAHVILENAMRLNPLYEKDDAFYLVYSVRSANKAADMIKGGEIFMRRFPQSSHIAEVMYLTGDAYFEMRKIQEARDYFKNVKDRFPDSDWGAKAAKRL